MKNRVTAFLYGEGTTRKQKIILTVKAVRFVVFVAIVVALYATLGV